MRLVKFRDHTDVKDIWVNADMVIYIEGESPTDKYDYTTIHMAVPLQYPRSVGSGYILVRGKTLDVIDKLKYQGNDM